VDVRYDGTVRSLSQIYHTHRDSPFHEVKHNTRKSYTDSLKIIERDVGARLVARLTMLDVKRWYKNWRSPAKPGGPERIKRAHDAIAMFRSILRFGHALRFTECGVLDEELGKVRFERSGSRQEEMTYVHAAAFIRAALDLGQRGVIPEERGLYMAIGIAAQFETLLRQKDIIGEWAPGQAGGAERRLRRVRNVDRLLHVGEHPRLALAHEDLEVEVPCRCRVRPDSVHAAAPTAGGGAYG